MESLWEAGASVRAYDPEARDETCRTYGERDDLVLCDEQYTVLDGADALVVIAERKAFRNPDFARIHAVLIIPVLFDGRNLYDPPSVEDAGGAYYGIGRGRSLQRVVDAPTYPVRDSHPFDEVKTSAADSTTQERRFDELSFVAQVPVQPCSPHFASQMHSLQRRATFVPSWGEQLPSRTRRT